MRHPSEVYKGDEVEAVVLDIDASNERFSLGIKQLHPDPWESLTNEYPRGSKVMGTVKKLTDYGAFIELAEGIEGATSASSPKSVWTARQTSSRSVKRWKSS